MKLIILYMANMTRAAHCGVELKAKLFRGFSDASRLMILEALRRGPRCVNEIVRLTGLSQPNVSLHLECLWCCGLVGRERDGRFVRYQIRSPRISRLLEEAERELRQIGHHIATCARYEGKRRKRGLVPGDTHSGKRGARALP